MFVAGTPTSAAPIAATDANDQYAMALSIRTAMTADLRRLTTTVQVTPLSAKDMTLTVTGTWNVAAISSNIDASVQ